MRLGQIGSIVFSGIFLFIIIYVIFVSCNNDMINNNIDSTSIEKNDSTVIELDTVRLYYYEEEDLNGIDSVIQLNNKLLRQILRNQNQQKDNIDHVKMFKNRMIVDSLQIQ